jgi:hypothetical protein
MNKKSVLQKLTSRKFFAMLMGFLTMVLVANGMPENQIAQITSMVGGFGGIIAYIFAEAYVDGQKMLLPEPVQIDEDTIEIDKSQD